MVDLNREYQICSNCVMDTTDPEIEFDEQGECSHCKTYKARVENELLTGTERERMLQEILDKIKARGKGRDYDCLIGISGGVDSTMVAYKCKELGLRPLAVHFDNGWNSELAVDNIKKCLNVLDIDLMTYVVDWEEFRDLQLSFLKASVPNCEIPTDHGISAVLWNTANQHDLGYIINGSNIATEGIMPLSWTYTSYDLMHLRAIHHRFGTHKLKTFPQLSLARFAYYVGVKKTRTVNLLNYIDYNKAEAMELIQDKLGWRYYGGKHYESIYTRFYQGYFLPAKFGFDKRRPHLSALVLAGQMTRDEALKELETDAYPADLMKEDRAFVLKKFGITEAQFDEIMRMPVKTHLDYPNVSTIHLKMKRAQAVFKKIAMKA